MAHPATRWQTMTDVYVDAGAVNWTSGAFYQVRKGPKNGGIQVETQRNMWV